MYTGKKGKGSSFTFLEKANNDENCCFGFLTSRFFMFLQALNVS